MGKGSDHSEKVEKTDQIEKIYTWNEINQHSDKDNLWIVINKDVYDVSKFQYRHPGGNKIVKFYGGQDATEAYIAFHKDEAKAKKYLKLYCIGKLDETSNNNLKESDKLSRREAMKVDFEDLRQVATSMNLFKPSIFFYVINPLHILFLNFLGYYIFYKFGTGLWPCLFALLCHATAQVQTNWTAHDYGHLSVFKTSKANRLMELFLMGCIKGYSARWWNHVHNSHHAKTNVINKDPDIRIEPLFVLGNVQPIRAAEKKIKRPNNKTLPYYYQHRYFFFGASAIFALYFQIITFRHVFKRKQYVDLMFMSTFYLTFFSILSPILGFSGVIGYFIIMRLCESFWFVIVSQSNHIVMDIHDEREEDAWLSLQLASTCNINKSLFNDWFTGHLNFQIEHHLFPTMPRHNLYKIQPLVKSLCEKHNIPYVIKPLGLAFKDILTSLEKSGRLYAEAFKEIRCEK